MVKKTYKYKRKEYEEISLSFEIDNILYFKMYK